VPGVAISVRVRRADTREPLGTPIYLTARRLEVRDGEERPVGHFLPATLEPDGRYRFRGLPQGRYRVDAHGARWFKDACRAVEVRAGGEVAEMEFLLRPRGEGK
jgi:hypothetical protein